MRAIVVGARHSFPDVARVSAEPDVPGGDFQRAAEHELPDEQERHQPPEPLASERLAQIMERAARARHRRAQLAPYHPVAEHDHESDDPAQQRLRATHRRHEQRDRDERSDADHVGHVQRRRGQKTEAAR